MILGDDRHAKDIVCIFCLEIWHAFTMEMKATCCLPIRVYLKPLAALAMFEYLIDILHGLHCMGLEIGVSGLACP